GQITWDKVGMSRTEAGLKEALEKIPKLKEEFYSNLKLVGSGEELNKALELAGRVSDFFELAELMARDALHRTESCGGHFREESQTPEGEAKRDDKNFSYVAAWEYKGEGQPQALHKEELKFENVKLAERSYK
ncbi:MAG: fumarate reductase/succinate dehydrogenase flavoprotein subunit, partial [Bdellovibrionota bacterium]